MKAYTTQPNQSELPLVLIVDNDRDNVLFASYIIESLGLRYVMTENGEECLDLVYQLLPDIILLDIVMPKVNGLEIARTIKQDCAIAHIAIIAITGLTKQEDQIAILEAGCDSYLIKPYLIEDLELKIFNCLQFRSS